MNDVKHAEMIKYYSKKTLNQLLVAHFQQTEELSNPTTNRRFHNLELELRVIEGFIETRQGECNE